MLPYKRRRQQTPYSSPAEEPPIPPPYRLPDGSWVDALPEYKRGKWTTPFHEWDPVYRYWKRREQPEPFQMQRVRIGPPPPDPEPPALSPVTLYPELPQVVPQERRPPPLPNRPLFPIGEDPDLDFDEHGNRLPHDQMPYKHKRPFKKSTLEQRKRWGEMGIMSTRRKP